MNAPNQPQSGLEQARALLTEGRPDKALEVLARTKDASAAADNARAVCLMRMGQAAKAVPIYRALLFGGGVTLRKDAPPAYVANYVTALLLIGNAVDAIDLLDDLRGPDTPGTTRLRAAVAQWKKSLGLFRRLLLSLSTYTPAKPFVLDFPAGEA